MNPDAYLKRIGHDGPVNPTADLLTSLHLAHMYSVPFENLDITLSIPIELDFDKLFEKVVGQNRGGFCYELNGLFGWLLNALGFEVEMFSARVYGRDGELGPDFDHMLLRVDKEFIADVGFGDSFTRPLRFNESEQSQETGTYRIDEKGGTYQLERNRGDDWSPQYLFTEERRGLDEFEEMCRFQQTSPDSIFTKKTVCSKATDEGRVTYTNGRFIETDSVGKRESGVDGVEELKTLLRKTFGFELGGGYDGLLGKSETASR